MLDFSEGNDCVNLGLTNPYFEFWLLLHFDIIDNYSEKDIKNLDLKKELKRILGSYNSSRLRFSDFKDGIGNALNNVEKFENKNLEFLLDNIGSTVGNLMNELLYNGKMCYSYLKVKGYIAKINLLNKISYQMIRFFLFKMI